MLRAVKGVFRMQQEHLIAVCIFMHIIRNKPPLACLATTIAEAMWYLNSFISENYCSTTYAENTVRKEFGKRIYILPFYSFAQFQKLSGNTYHVSTSTKYSPMLKVKLLLLCHCRGRSNLSTEIPKIQNLYVLHLEEFKLVLIVENKRVFRECSCGSDKFIELHLVVLSPHRGKSYNLF